MSSSTWQLPGPSRFVSRVVSDLRGGTSVILHVPPHVPPGLARAVRLAMDADEYVRWCDLTDVQVDETNAVTITASLQNQVARGAGALGEMDRFVQQIEDTVFWLSVAAPTDWTTWREFLERFRLANHRLEESQRGVFCVLLPSDAPAGDDDVGLAVRAWKGAVAEIDVLQLVDARLRSHGSQDGLWHALFANVAVELAGTDLGLAARLADCSIEQLLQPLPVVCEHVEANPWLRQAQPCWENGCADLRNGHPYRHTGWIAAKGDADALDRRVWQGQLGVLFPFIERRRLELLPRVRHKLSLPVETGAGIVTDPEDLEWGQLVHFLRNQHLSPALWGEVRNLRNVRHSLAHLRPAPYEMICKAVPNGRGSALT